MATLYIAEYGVTKGIGGLVAPIVACPPLAEQTVAIGGASVQSSAFTSNTNIIRVHTDAICSVLIDTDPTVTAVKSRMAANQTEYFGVRPGDKIAVITNT